MRQALAFLTPLRVGATPPDARTLDWFPVAGACIGLVVGAAWWAAGEMFPPLLAAAIVVTVDLAVTGALHVDGLADASDGLLGHLTTERRLEVMAAPDVGAFGVAAVGAALLLRVGALASLAPDPLLIAGLWCASRTAMAVIARKLRYARPGGGLASAFLDGSAPLIVGLVGAALAVALAATGAGVAGATAVVAVAAGAAGVARLARRRIGGFTGDVLGAAGLVGETAGLVVAAGTW